MILAWILGGVAVLAAVPFVLIARGANLGDDELLVSPPTAARIERSEPLPRRTPPPVPPQDGESWPGALGAVLNTTDESRVTRDGEDGRPTTHYALAFCRTNPPSDPDDAQHVVTATRCGAVEDFDSFAYNLAHEGIDCEECRAALGRNDLETLRVWHLRAGRVIGGGDA